MPLSYHTNPRGVPGFKVGISTQGSTDPAASSTQAVIPAIAIVDSNGTDVNAATSYVLASNITVTATTGTTPVTGITRGNYVWDAQFTGTSIKLQSLGSDGVTWRDVATLAASGTFAGEIRFGANAQVRLYNPNGTSDTGVYSSLS